MSYSYTPKSYKAILEKSPRLIMMGKEDIQRPFARRFPHEHNYLEILMVYEGTGIHSIRDEEFFVSAGNIIIHNAHQIHGRIQSEGMRLYSCFAEDIFLPGLPRNCLVPEGRHPVLQQGEDTEEYLAINKRMYAYVSENKAEPASYLLRYYLWKLYEGVQGQALPSQRDENALELAKRIKDYLDSHYDEDALSLSAVSKELHISLYYLSHIFKGCYHISPMQYVKYRRVGEAQTLLSDSTRNITEIALQVGFSSANQFHHAFAQMVGTSPAKYRKHWRS